MVHDARALLSFTPDSRIQRQRRQRSLPAGLSSSPPPHHSVTAGRDAGRPSTAVVGPRFHAPHPSHPPPPPTAGIGLRRSRPPYPAAPPFPRRQRNYIHEHNSRLVCSVKAAGKRERTYSSRLNTYVDVDAAPLLRHVLLSVRPVNDPMPSLDGRGPAVPSPPPPACRFAIG